MILGFAVAICSLNKAGSQALATQSAARVVFLVRRIANYINRVYNLRCGGNSLLQQYLQCIINESNVMFASLDQSKTIYLAGFVILFAIGRQPSAGQVAVAPSAVPTCSIRVIFIIARSTVFILPRVRIDFSQVHAVAGDRRRWVRAIFEEQEFSTSCGARSRTRSGTPIRCWTSCRFWAREVVVHALKGFHRGIPPANLSVRAHYRWRSCRRW